MRSQEEKGNRTSTSKRKDNRTRRELLLLTMVAAVATVMIGSDYKWLWLTKEDLEKDSHQYNVRKEVENGDENGNENGGIEIGGGSPL